MTHAAVPVREGYVEVTAGRVWYRVVGGGNGHAAGYGPWRSWRDS